MKLLVGNFLVSIILITVAGVVTSSSAYADTFGNGANTFEIELVTIGDPGNPADTESNPDPFGSVAYTYGIGKFEISEQMIDKANALGGLGITKDNRGPDKPATSISWFEAAKFVNWLNESTGNTPAYKFIEEPAPRPNATIETFALWESGDVGYNPNNLFRNNQAKYVLPSSDEWYKAAYYDPATNVWNQFPTGAGDPTAVASGTDPGTAVFFQDLATGPADIMQAGGLSPYGTRGQGGNVSEWEETEFDLVNDSIFGQRGGRGGFWDTFPSGLSSSSRSSGLPSIAHFGVGFRVVRVPEASSFNLLCIAISIGLAQYSASRK